MGASQRTAAGSIATLVAVFAVSGRADAEPGWIVEAEPASLPWVADSLYLRFNLGAANWRLDSGAAARQLPQILVDLTNGHRHEGWQIDLDQGLGFSWKGYLSDTPTGWFAGLQAANWTVELQRDELAADARSDSWLIMPYGGYLYDISESAYLQAWAGLGFTSQNHGGAWVDGEAQEVVPLTGFATVHLGYRF